MTVPTFFRDDMKVADLIEITLAVLILSFGVVLSTKAGLGTSPVSSLPYVISLGSGISLGITILAVYTVLVAIQWILLRRKGMKRIMMTVTQLPFTVLFGLFVDLIENTLSGWTIDGAAMQWIAMFLSMIIIAFGVTMEIDADVSMLADDGLVLALHETTGIPLDKVLVIFNLGFVSAAFILSFILFDGMYGVGVGTLISMVGIGAFVRPSTKFIKRYIRPDGHLD